MYDVDLFFQKARELVDFFDEKLFTPQHVFDVSEKGTCGYFFRGQADKTWPLLPQVHRSDDVLSGFTPQPPDRQWLAGGKKLEYLAFHLHAELRAVFLFLEEADRLGIQTPLAYAAMNLHTPLLNEVFNRQVGSVKQEFPDHRILPSMALAQHHGVPTRLLDWTESPFVAAYFAAAAASAIAGQSRSESEFAVFCLGTQLLSRIKSIEAVSAPRFGNSFLRAQRGGFTLIRDANAFFIEHNHWPSIEDVVQRERNPSTLYPRPPLIRLSLPASEADELLRILFRHGITRHDLMPSLSNAAKAVSYKMALWPLN